MSTDITSTMNSVLQTKIDSYLNSGDSKRKRADDTEENDDIQIEEIDENSDKDNLNNLMKLMVMYMKNIDLKVGNLEKKVEEHNQHCTGINNLRSELTEIKSQLSTAAPSVTDQNKYEEDSKLKFSKISDWGQLHRKRRDAFYRGYSEQAISNEIEKWITPDDDNKVYIKREYRDKYIPGESDERYKIRENLAIQKMVANIQLRRIKVDEMEEECKNIDNSVFERLNQLTDDTQRDYLKALWREETSAAEQRSKSFWDDKKMKWWTKRREEDPYLGKPKERSYAEAVNSSENNDQPEVMDETEPGKENDGEGAFQVVVNKNKRTVKTQQNQNYQHNNSEDSDNRTNYRKNNNCKNNSYNKNRGSYSGRPHWQNNQDKGTPGNKYNNFRNNNRHSGNRDGNFFRRDQNYKPNR